MKKFYFKKLFNWSKATLLLCVLLLLGTSKTNAQITIFSEDWGSSSFNTNGWTFDPSQGNWNVGSSYAPSGATSPNAYFNWSPAATNYSFSLVSDTIDGTSYVNATLDYKLELDNYSSSTVEGFKIEYKKLWQTSWTVLMDTTNASFAGLTIYQLSSSNVSMPGIDTAMFQIRFTAYGANSFNINGWGLDDIVVKGTPSTACSGSPVAGTVSGPSGVCSGANFLLSSTGYTAASGLTYQWQAYNTVTSLWDSIGNTPNFTVVGGQTVATDYRFVVTCGNGGGQDISSTVSVAMNNFYNCYCSPLLGTTLSQYSGSNYIANVTIVGTGLNNTTTSAGPNGYTQYSNTIPANTASLVPGLTYTINIGLLYSYDNAAAWIDWDQSGTFDAGEQITINGGTGTFTVPLTATSGLTGFRARANDWGYTYTSSCMNDYGGETEDYMVTIPVLTACSGTPDPVTASGPTGVCSGASFNLTATGMSIGTGITYQWQVYNALTSTWDSIGNTPAVTVAGGQTVASDYRFVTTCANGGGQDISNTVTVGMNQFYSCYCSPLIGTTLSNYFYANYINNVTIVGTTLNNSTTTVGTNGYTMFSPTITSNTASLVPGLSYTINVGMYYPTYDYVNAWIDYDHSGTFDAGEQILLTSASGGATATFTIPLTATAGITGLRVRCNDDGISNYSGSCINDYYGETEDYQITIPVLTACSGTPDPVTASGPTGVCSGASFNLTATGMSIGTGISYQWQVYNTLTSTWDSIGNTTGLTISAGQTVASDYRFVTTCANGGGQDISNTVSVAMNNFYTCYCSPLLGTTLSQYAGTNYITNVTIQGTPLNNTTTTAGTGGYTQYSSSIANNTATLAPGGSYTITMGMYYPSYDYASVWFDWDQSGTFDAGEQYPMTSNGTTGASVTVTVPVTALAGVTGFRVRCNDWGYTYSSSCMNDYGGETEDYLVTIPVLVNCTGTPTAGTAYGPAGVCPSTAYTVSDSLYTIGAGVTYKWEVYNTVTSTWDSVGNSPAYTATAGQTVATDYRLVVTCTNSGQQNISNTVTVPMNSFFNCYCNTTNAGGSGSMIDQVDFGGLSNNSSTSNPTSSPYYTYYNLTANVTSGATAPFSVTIGPSGTYSGAIVSVWIDFNHNGLYEASEWTQIGTNCPAGAVTTTNIQIPITALTGVTGMRVRSRGAGNQNGAGDACLNMGSGETEDYLVNIAAATGCTGTPSAGTAYGPSGACTGVAFNLNDSAYTVASGITFQWQSSPAGMNTWTDIAGANNPSSYTVTSQTAATDYRLKDSCGNSMLVAYSNVVSVSQNAPTTCYCIPGATNPNVGDQILNVTLGTINNSTGVGNSNGYNDYTSTVTPTSLNQLSSYSMSMTINYGGTEYGGVWIDYDQSGTFDPSEFTDMGSGSTSPSITLTQSIIIPSTATLGTTRMRVRSKYGSALASTDACSGYADGETEDYNVNIINPLAIKLTDINATNVGTRNRVDWNTGAEDHGDYFIVERSADGRNYTDLGTVNAKGTASTYSYWDENPYGGINYYRLKMMDASGNSSYSKVVTATVKGNGAFTVDAFPNPVSDMLTVQVYGNSGSNAVVTITDVTGKVVKVVTVENNKATISMSELAAGMYLVKYTDSDHSQILKVNKK